MESRQERRERVNRDMEAYAQTGQTLTGRVTYLHLGRQDKFVYGFITPDNTELDDIFAHWKEVEPWRDGFKELKRGDVVRFRVARGQEGKWQAVQIEVARAPVDESKFEKPETSLDQMGTRDNEW